MNSILYFDPARDRWDSRRPDSIRRPDGPLTNINTLSITWVGGNEALNQSENQAARVDHIIREHNPTLIALAGVPRSFISHLLTQQTVRNGYAFSSIEGDVSCALLWKMSFAVLLVEPKTKSFPCLLAHSRDLFGAPAVIATAAFTANDGQVSQLREIWDTVLSSNSISDNTTALGMCYVGTAGNTANLAAGLRSSIAKLQSGCDAPHAIWFRNAEGNQITSPLDYLQHFGDAVTHITLSQLAAPGCGGAPISSGAATAVAATNQQQPTTTSPNVAPTPAPTANISSPNSGTATPATGGNIPQNQQQQQAAATTTNAPATTTTQQTQQQGRQWNFRNCCNIKVREHTVELLYDLTPFFPRIDDCLRVLNLGPEVFNWRSDFAVCHGRLFACLGTKPDLKTFQLWMSNNDAPMNHEQRQELLSKPRILTNLGLPPQQQNQSPVAAPLPQQQQQQQQQNIATTTNMPDATPTTPATIQQQFPTSTSTGIASQIISGVATVGGAQLVNTVAGGTAIVQPSIAAIQQQQVLQQVQQQQVQHIQVQQQPAAVVSYSNIVQHGGGAKYFRRGWSINRAVLVNQVGPAELAAFDVTAEVGVIPRPLQTLVDRLNATHRDSSSGTDSLATYSKDYALCYSAERRGYWLVAAPNVPCDPLIARAVALQLRRQKLQQQQQQQQAQAVAVA